MHFDDKDLTSEVIQGCLTQQLTGTNHQLDLAELSHHWHQLLKLLPLHAQSVILKDALKMAFETGVPLNREIVQTAEDYYFAANITTPPDNGLPKNPHPRKSGRLDGDIGLDDDD